MMASNLHQKTPRWHQATDDDMLFRERKTDFKFITSLRKRNLAPELPKALILTASACSLGICEHNKAIYSVCIALIQNRSFQLTV